MVKAYTFFLILFLLLPMSSVMAQDEEIDLQMACEKYIACLKTGHCEIINATSIHLMKMYHQYPAQDYSQIIATLDSLNSTGCPQNIMKVVLLAKQYLSGEKNLDWMMAFNYEEIYNFLKMIYSGRSHDLAFDKFPGL